MTDTPPNRTETEPRAAQEQQNREPDSQARLLQEQLVQVTARAVAAEKELDAMLHYISHDLRAPLRGIDGYSRALLEDYDSQLDEVGKAYLHYICESSARLNQLIEALLRYSRILRRVPEIGPVDLSEMALEISRDLQSKCPERQVEIIIAPGLACDGDVEMAYVLLKSLLENAFKFTSKHPAARIEFGKADGDGKAGEDSPPAFFVRDDGAGYDMAYQSQLFLPFQRLHGQHEFDGLGLGLATAQRIIQRHNGRIWAEGAPEKGATFYFVI